MQGIKLLAIFKNKKNCQANKIDNIITLHFPQGYTNKLKQYIDKNASNYTTWIESADTFLDLKAQIEKRSYSNIYYSGPLFPFENEPTYNVDAPDMRHVDLKTTKSMLQRGS